LFLNLPVQLLNDRATSIISSFRDVIKSVDLIDGINRNPEDQEKELLKYQQDYLECRKNVLNKVAILREMRKVCDSVLDEI